MPTYEYQCKGCGKEFDFEHGMQEVVDTCPLCSSRDVERLIPGGLGIHGLSLGRFSSANDNTYDHFHVPTEMKQMMKKMEADGEFKKDPAFAAKMERKYKNIMRKEHTYERMDYQKTGHPCVKSTKNLAEI